MKIHYTENFEQQLLNISDTDIQLDESFNSTEKIIKLLKFINSNSKYQELILGIKDVSTENKIEVFKYLFSDKELTNYSCIINVYNFIKTYNSLDDKFFTNKLVFVKNIEEFLDIKLALKDQIQQYIDDFVGWYLSLFMYVSKIDVNFLEKSEKLPMSYQVIINMVDMVSLSGICQKANIKSIMLHEMPISDSLNIVNRLVQKMQLVENLYTSLLNNIK